MSNWQNHLRQQSYSQSFIWKAAIAILAVSLAIGAIVDLLVDSRTGLLRQRLTVDLANPGLPYDDGLATQDGLIQAALIAQLEGMEFTLEEFIALAPYLTPYGEGARGSRIDALLESRFDAEVTAMLTDFLAAFSSSESDARRRLESKASTDPPARYANRFLGEIEAFSGYYYRAYPYFKREGSLPDAEVARSKAVTMLRYDDNFEELQALLALPEYAKLITPRIQIDIAIHHRDWLTVAKLLPVDRYSSFDGKMALIAAITALVWAAILFRLGQFDSWMSRAGGLCGLAFVAGAISTLPTLLLVIIENAYVGYQPDGDLIPTVAFFIGGVGLREELCKLLFFLPFAFYLAKQGDERQTLIVASFVGLGFAAEENVGYFAQSLALAAPGRFLTANFLHIALTGLGGLYLCRSIRQSSYNDFLYVFGIMIVVHGLYDVLLSLPQLESGSFFAMAVFILLSMRYFAELYSQSVQSRPAYSLSFLFVCGLCLILSSLIIFQASQIGLSTALKLISLEAIGSALIVFMFFREFNEPLGP